MMTKSNVKPDEKTTFHHFLIYQQSRHHGLLAIHASKLSLLSTLRSGRHSWVALPNLFPDCGRESDRGWDTTTEERMCARVRTLETQVRDWRIGTAEISLLPSRVWGSDRGPISLCAPQTDRVGTDRMREGGWVTGARRSRWLVPDSAGRKICYTL